VILIYPGSFDPVTLGHIDIAMRGAKIATKLIVAVLDNSNKTSFFTITERVALLKEALGNTTNIEVDEFSGLLVEYAHKKNATAILRGIRNPADYESEARYAECNRLLSQGDSKLETIFLPASPSLSFISSSIVREAALHIYKNNYSEAALQKLVPLPVCNALKNRIKIGQGE